MWSMKPNIPKVTNSWHNYMRNKVVQDFQHNVLEMAPRTYDENVLAKFPVASYEFPNGYSQVI